MFIIRKCCRTKNSFMLMYFLFIFNVNALSYEGDKCTRSGLPGTCVNIKRCQSAIDDIRRRINPQICSFDGQDPIVCCVDGPKEGTTTTTQRTTTTTRRYAATPPPRQQQQSTTEYIPPVYDYKEDEGSNTCQPIASQLTTQKTGRKAWDKCLEYQEQLVYPCETGVALAGELTRANYCHHNANELIVGGTDASRDEFPHMVLLGYGTNPQSASWVCGGTLISDKFVLTAGHCTFSREYGDVKYVQVGLLKRSELNLKRVYEVNRIIKHPEYKPPNKYNDIALLETKTRIPLSHTVVPACLDVGAGVSYDHASATGWGLTTDRGLVSEVLQKVTLTKFPTLECMSTFPPDRRMKEGLQDTQVCYGDRTKSKDTCQGDSGGPLQVLNTKINCMYTVIGVTSFGKACGFEGVPAVYTKVSGFTAWIESVVWP